MNIRCEKKKAIKDNLKFLLGWGTEQLEKCSFHYCDKEACKKDIRNWVWGALALCCHFTSVCRSEDSSLDIQICRSVRNCRLQM